MISPVCYKWDRNVGAVHGLHALHNMSCVMVIQHHALPFHQSVTEELDAIHAISICYQRSPSIGLDIDVFLRWRRLVAQEALLESIMLLFSRHLWARGRILMKGLANACDDSSHPEYHFWSVLWTDKQ